MRGSNKLPKSFSDAGYILLADLARRTGIDYRALYQTMTSKKVPFTRTSPTGKRGISLEQDDADYLVDLHKRSLPGPTPKCTTEIADEVARRISEDGTTLTIAIELTAETYSVSHRTIWDWYSAGKNLYVELIESGSPYSREVELDGLTFNDRRYLDFYLDIRRGVARYKAEVEKQINNIAAEGGNITRRYEPDDDGDGGELKLVHKTVKTDADLLMRILQFKFPEDYSTTQRVDINHSGLIDHKVEGRLGVGVIDISKLASLTPEVAEEILQLHEAGQLEDEASEVDSGVVIESELAGDIISEELTQQARIEAEQLDAELEQRRIDQWLPKII